jgi:hypothetical protein
MNLLSRLFWKPLNLEGFYTFCSTCKTYSFKGVITVGLDFIMEYEKAKKLVDEKGWDGF